MSNECDVFTIGFTKTTAERFFSRLQSAGVKKIIDVRLNNTSQLSGFAKSIDLEYFLKKIAGIEYIHIPLLAPTNDLLSTYKKNNGLWDDYANSFTKLMSVRKIEEKLDYSLFANACLLCSEAEPHFCHRRLVCDYLNDQWSNSMTVTHL